MPQLGPHISISDEHVLSRVFGLDPEEYADWPDAVRDLAAGLASELFLVRYNPFIDPEWVRESVDRRLNIARPALSGEYPQLLQKCVRKFWRTFDEDRTFREDMLARLRRFLPESALDLTPNSRVECATDATDLRIDLPMAVLFPETTAQIQAIVKLANEMGFGVVPRGGGTGLTGGAIPGGPRTVILSLSRLKKIVDVNPEDMTICGQAGVLTLTAIHAAAERGLLFTVDPASKSASTLGGNVAENSGGPFAFEYGTTIDNILNFTMVTARGEIIQVRRVDHPRHKIFPDETARFEVADQSGKVIESLEIPGADVRKPGLGKDVTNKFLGGLPGVQKEGVDGIITQACFVCHPRPSLSRVLCLEFFGRSMHNAMLVIRDVVGLRDRIRETGDLVKISALEEFGPKYVQAIDYTRKSEKYEGDPISVLILQLDSDDREALDEAVASILNIAEPFDNVDIFAARDAKEAELFWEDRHKLSAIAKRTSGFKINEDVVIPLEVIPEFSSFIENLNLVYLARANRTALAKVMDLPGVKVPDEFIEMEREVALNILNRKLTVNEISDQEYEAQIHYFFQDLRNRYPKQDRRIEAIYQNFLATRVVVANHMHAGDGNCHVNFPVNSNDPDMLEQVHEAVDEVFAKVQELGGAITGEHGIGITKIGYLSDEKIEALRKYKQRVDPGNVLNPGKLVRRKLPAIPYTFSFNRLIRDLDATALKDKERLITLLKNIQACTRCGKCKQACPMYHPQQGLMFHPRNKNISLGALIEALYYSQHKDGKPDPELLDRLRSLMEHCTACGKCTGVCPIKIDSAGAALQMRAFLEEKGRGGHPVKSRILQTLAQEPSTRLPKVAKFLSIGQTVANRFVGLAPAPWRRKLVNPALQGVGPHIDFKNLPETLKLDQGSLFQAPPVGKQGIRAETVLYFPGCGANLFSRSIGMAALYLLSAAGVNTVMPRRHLCCGYPLLASGCVEAYNTNRHRTTLALQELLARASVAGMETSVILTSCGTCRESVTHYGLDQEIGASLTYMDVAQYVLDKLPAPSTKNGGKILYHAACHAEWEGVPLPKAAEAYRSAVEGFFGVETALSPGCCGESGLGALTSPEIYNRVRNRKKEQLSQDLEGADRRLPVVVGCPSCKIGIKRSLIQMKKPQRVLHVLELAAERIGGPKWRKDLTKRLDKAERRDGLVILP